VKTVFFNIKTKRFFVILSFFVALSASPTPCVLALQGLMEFGISHGKRKSVEFGVFAGLCE
jgi:hypothetical protein